MTHSFEARPHPPVHPLEDEVELFEESEDVPGELDRADLIDELADKGLAAELADFELLEAEHDASAHPSGPA